MVQDWFWERRVIGRNKRGIVIRRESCLCLEWPALRQPMAVFAVILPGVCRGKKGRRLDDCCLCATRASAFVRKLQFSRSLAGIAWLWGGDLIYDGKGVIPPEMPGDGEKGFRAHHVGRRALFAFGCSAPVLAVRRWDAGRGAVGKLDSLLCRSGMPVSGVVSAG